MKQNQKLRGLLLGAAAALVGMVALPSAMGQVIYEVGFEKSDDFLVGAVGGQGSPAWRSGSSYTGSIVESVGGIEAPQGDQMLSMQRPSGSSDRYARVDFADYQAGAKEDIRFSFLISADTKTNAAVGVSIGSTSMSNSGAWFGLRSPDASGTSGDFNFYYREGGSSTYHVIDSNAKLTLGEFVRVEIDILWKDGNSTFNLTVWDLDANGINNSILAQKNGIDLYYSGENSAPIDNFNRILVDIDQVGNTNFLFDDFRISQIPEPSSIALLALSLAGLLLMSTRRRHSLIG